MALISKIALYNTDIDVNMFVENAGQYVVYKKRNLKDYRMHLSKQHNQLEPTSNAFYESIEIEMDAPEASESYLQEWFISQESRDLVISTTIDIAHSPEGNETHQIICKGAECYSFEDFVVDENTFNAKRRIRIFFEAKMVIIVHNKEIIKVFKHQ